MSSAAPPQNAAAGMFLVSSTTNLGKPVRTWMGGGGGRGLHNDSHGEPPSAAPCHYKAPAGDANLGPGTDAAAATWSLSFPPAPPVPEPTAITVFAGNASHRVNPLFLGCHTGAHCTACRLSICGYRSARRHRLPVVQTPATRRSRVAGTRSSSTASPSRTARRPSTRGTTSRLARRRRGPGGQGRGALRVLL